MGWLSKRLARNQDSARFDPEAAFLRFASAATLKERRAAVAPQMLTKAYDAWLAEYIVHRWTSGDADVAESLQRYRFALRLCYETSVDTALPQLDPAFPASCAARLDGATIDPSAARPAQVEVMIAAVQSVLTSIEGASLTPYQRSLLETTLADGLTELGLSGEGIDRFNQAMTHYEQAIQLSPPLECLWSSISGKAAMTVNQRYFRTGSLRDLDLTLHNAEVAISAALPKQLELADFHAIWAAGLRNTADLVEDSMYWSAASSAFRQAAALAQPTDPRRDGWIESAGACLLNASLAPLQSVLPAGLQGSTIVEMHRQLDANPELKKRVQIIPKNDREISDDEMPDNIDKTIVVAERRLEVEREGTRGFWAQGLTLAQVLLNRYRVRRDDADLQRADQLAKSAIAHLRDDSLLTAYLVKSDVAEIRGANSGQVAELLAPGVRWASANPSLRGMELSIDCAEQSIRAQNWALAADAYSAAERIHSSLVQRQVGRGYQENILVRGPALGALAALAHTHNGDADKAAEVIDLGRAQLMSSALRRDEADLSQVRSLGAGHLADDYLASVRELGQAGGHDQPDVALAAAQDHFAAAAAAIRRLPGLGDFLLPLDADALRAVARRSRATILYLFATRHGGAAVTVSGERIAACLVDGLTEQDLHRYAAAAAVPPGTSPHTRAIDAACRWLGDLLEPVLRAMPMAHRVCVVPSGLLVSLPIHAAWVPARVDRRYLFEDRDVSYTANALALRASEDRAVRGQRWSSVVVVEQPDGAGIPLPLASFEAEIAAECFRRLGARVDAPDNADVPLVLESLSRADAIHLACHADADPSQPLNSGVTLADNTRLTVAAVMAAEVRARLVVVSACESGVSGRALPDEMVSLPSGLIEGGCGSVVASLWRVADDPTALMMLEFYRQLKSGVTASVALSEARAWLREATNDELLAAVHTYGPACDGYRALERRFSLAEPDQRPFAEIAHWAAFVHVGA